MRKFFILCLMAFVMCSCNNIPPKRIIKTEKWTFYEAKDYFGDIVQSSTEPKSVVIDEYNTNGMLVHHRMYYRHSSDDIFKVEEHITHNEQGEIIKIDTYKTISWDDKQNEHIILYEVDGVWVRVINGGEPQVMNDFTPLRKPKETYEEIYLDEIEKNGVYIVSKKYNVYGDITEIIAKHEYEYCIMKREIEYYNNI